MQELPSNASRIGAGNDDLPARVTPEAVAVSGEYLSPQGYGQPFSDEGGNLVATIGAYVRMVVKRRWLILSVLIGFIAIGGLKTLMTTPLYRGVVRVQIDREPAKIVEGGLTAPIETFSTDFLRTEFELMKSRNIAERAVSSLQLQDNPDFLKARDISLLSLIADLSHGSPKEEPTAASREASAVFRVMKSVLVNPVPGSRLVDISYTDTKPNRAQSIANAYADAYVASRLDKRFQANAYAKTFLEDQIKQLKIRLEDSERAQLEFAEKERIVEVNEKANIAETDLAAAHSALGQFITARVKSEQLWKQVDSSNAINLSQLLTNSVIDGLRSRRNALAMEYEEKLQTYKPSYPDMMQIAKKLKEIDRQLGTEVKTIRASLRASYEAALNQEVEMKLRIGDLRNKVLDLQKKGIRYNILKREVETNRSLYNSLLQRYKEVDIASGAGTNNIFIVDRAITPQVPSEPNLMRALLVSLILGLVFGLGLAYVLELMDDRIRAPEDIEQITGLATLGVIPRTGDEENFDEQLNDPRSGVAEAYRSLATALQFSTAAGLPRSLAVTSSGAGEGKSSTAIALARHFSTMGMKVLLIDGDLRKPTLHTKLGMDNGVGLSNYLTGSATPPEVIQDTVYPNLALMASGPLPPNAADLLGGTRMFSLVKVGLEVFDLIVIDAPPMLGLADAQLIASAVSASIFIVGAGQQRRGMIRSALRRLQLGRIHLIGSVLTKFDSSAVGYGYGYAYGYGYGAEAYQYGNTVSDDGGSGRRRQLSGKRAA